MFATARELEIDRLIARPMKQRIFEALGQAPVRLGQVRPVMPHQVFQQPVVMGHHPGSALGPRQDDTLLKRLVRVSDHQAFVEHRPLAQPGAGRAGAVRRVEREMPRRHRVVAFAGGRAGESVRQLALPPLRAVEVGRLVQRDELSLAPLEAGLNRVGQAAARLVPDDQPVDHDLDRVLLFWVEFETRVGLELRQFAVDASSDEALASQFFQHVAKLAFLPLNHRRE